MTTDPANPFGATGTGAGHNPRSNDPVPPDADLPAGTPGAQDWPAPDRTDTDADREEFEAWRAQRDEDERTAAADRLARGEAAEGEPACPACGASTTNPAHHERLPYCWKCGFGAAAGQDYPVPERTGDR